MADNVSISAGDLNRRIEIKQPVYGVVADEISDWTVWATVWAQRTPVGAGGVGQGREIYSSQHEASEEWASFRIRYRDPLPTSKMRVVHKGQNFDIRIVVHIDNGNEAIDLVCRKVE